MQALVVQSHFHLMVLDVAVLIWGLPEWIGSYRQRAKKRGATRRDRGSYLFLVAVMMAGMFTAFVCMQAVTAATLTWRQPLLFWTGIVLIVGGVAFRWYAIRVLGRFFTRDVAIHSDQHVVDSGPYRLIRHPSYSGALISVFGFGLALTNWLSMLVVMGATVLGFSYRVHVEERALCDALGNAYRDYMKRTRRFIPYLW